MDETESSHLLDLAEQENFNPATNDHSNHALNENSFSSNDNIENNINIHEILYAIDAFVATVKPVALTLVLSSLSVLFVQSPLTPNDDGGLQTV
jgi:hypothetical protein